MRERMDFVEARNMLLKLAEPVGVEPVLLERSAGRILAQDIAASENVPAFDRSPYDGYAFRAADTAEASSERPAVLGITEEIPAGGVPAKRITKGTAAKILTGAPIPEGADAVIMYEKTEYTDSEVRIFSPVKPGTNIIRAGEDVKAGQLLAETGTEIDAGLAGTLASQGISHPVVFRRAHIALISTGSELLEPGSEIQPGRIYNSNRYVIEAALEKTGCTVEYLGITGDSAESIASLIRKGLSGSDAVILTGGVSAGDYDLTPKAMALAGAEILIRGVDMKPGMACAFGICDGKLVLGLSGNPAAAATNLYSVVLPAVKRLCGRKECLPAEVSVTLAEDFNKKSKNTRLLRGRLDLSDGTAKMHVAQDQGNVVISSMIGCDVIAVIPSGSGALKAGTALKGFLI